MYVYREVFEDLNDSEVAKIFEDLNDSKELIFMSYSTYSVLYRLLKHKYNVPQEASYMQSVQIMKERGITDEELDALHEVWSEQIED